MINTKNITNPNPKKKINIWTIIFIIMAFLSIVLYIQSSFLSVQVVSDQEMRSRIQKEILEPNDKPEERNIKIITFREQTSTTSLIIFEAIKKIQKLMKTGKKITLIAKGTKRSITIEKKLWDDASHFWKTTGYITENYLNTKKTWFQYVANVFSYIFPLLITFAILFFFLKMMGSGGGILGSLKSSFKGTKFAKSDIKFSDVAGLEEEKKELIEIVDFLKNSKKYTSMGARIPKGLLLFGPPGTGKTLLAKAVSGESDVPFLSVAASEFEEMIVGLGASRVRTMFEKAKKNAPCIIFIDEIDAIGGQRRGLSSTGDQTLNQFLAEMDGFDTKAGVVIIGATNRTEILDPALLRSGRFDRKIQIGLPDLQAREDILKLHSKNKNIAKEVKLSEIAAKTPGFSGAELENCLNEAALVAVRYKKTIISNFEIEEGIDRVVGGPAKTSKIINPKTKLLVSIHEAGHALIGMMLNDAQVVQKVTIIPRGSAGGYTITTPKDETLINTKKSLYEQVAGLLGGRVAEELIFGEEEITTGAYDDLKKATNIAIRMVEEFGMSEFGLRFKSARASQYLNQMQEKNMSNIKMQELDESIDKILDIAYKLSKETIAKEKKLLLLISEALLVLETITLPDIKYIYENRKLPKKVIEIKEQNPTKKYLDLSLIKK